MVVPGVNPAAIGNLVVDFNQNYRKFMENIVKSKKIHDLCLNYKLNILQA